MTDAQFKKHLQSVAYEAAQRMTRNVEREREVARQKAQKPVETREATNILYAHVLEAGWDERTESGVLCQFIDKYKMGAELDAFLTEARENEKESETPEDD